MAGVEGAILTELQVLCLISSCNIGMPQSAMLGNWCTLCQMLACLLESKNCPLVQWREAKESMPDVRGRASGFKTGRT